MKTALQSLSLFCRAHLGDIPKDQMLEKIAEYMEDEKRQIVDAWIKGNEEGWEMNTDWPEDGERYYNQKYNVKKQN